MSSCKPKHRCVAIFALLFFMGVSVHAAQPSLSSRLDVAVRKQVRKGTACSIHVRDVATGKSLYARRCDTAMIPASNMKLITTAAAADRFGADFACITRIGLWGGHLVVLGSGDPLLGTDIDPDHPYPSWFGTLKDQLADANVTVIGGDMIIDDTCFEDLRFHPSWDRTQADKHYAAQVSGVNYYRNCLDITVVPGSPITYSLFPRSAYVSITNSVKRGSKDAIGASRILGTNDITLWGTCKTAQGISTTIERPSAWLGYMLAEYLLANGISIQGKLVVRAVPELHGSAVQAAANKPQWLVAVRRPLSDILAACNQNSFNLAAESLFKLLGAAGSTGTVTSSPDDLQTSGSWHSGAAAVSAFLKRLGVRSDQFTIDDGSGLSPHNRISTAAITTVLCAMAGSPASAVYRDSLCTPSTGTLGKRHRFADCIGRIWAKTGYIKRVRAISGYCLDPNDTLLAFSIILNGPGSTAALDRIADAVMGVK